MDNIDIGSSLVALICHVMFKFPGGKASIFAPSPVTCQLKLLELDPDQEPNIVTGHEAASYKPWTCRLHLPSASIA